MISVEKICYHYRGYPDTLQDVSFQMNGGEFLAVLGNNGVGKSTLLKCFNHILSADSGKVCWMERIFWPCPFWRWRKGLHLFRRMSRAHK